MLVEVWRSPDSLLGRKSSSWVISWRVRACVCVSVILVLIIVVTKTHRKTHSCNCVYFGVRSSSHHHNCQSCGECKTSKASRVIRSDSVTHLWAACQSVCLSVRRGPQIKESRFLGSLSSPQLQLHTQPLKITYDKSIDTPGVSWSTPTGKRSGNPGEYPFKT